MEKLKKCPMCNKDISEENIKPDRTYTRILTNLNKELERLKQEEKDFK